MTNKIFAYTLKSLPFQVLLSFILAIISSHMLSKSLIIFFFTVSTVLKGALLFILPFLIISYISSSISSFARSAPFLIFGTIALVVFSNSCALFIAYFVGKETLPFFSSSEIAVNIQGLSEPPKVWFHFPFSSIISSDNALIVGIVLGLLIALIPSLRALEKHIIASREFLCKIIKLGFIPLIPLYVFGFILSLQQTGGLSIIVKNYLITFLITWTLIISYIFFLYFAGANFNFKRCLEFIKRIFPALITAFSTMSSAATIPITLNATEKNTENKEYARFVIPTTASIHMIAGNIIVTILGLSLLQFSGAKFPTLIEFLPFVFYFCLAKFSAVGVPGGSIIVLIPVVEKYLGLNEELSTLLLSICLLTDALETAGNVAGNGAFAILANKVLAFNQKLKLAEQ